MQTLLQSSDAFQDAFDVDVVAFQVDTVEASVVAVDAMDVVAVVVVEE